MSLDEAFAAALERVAERKLQPLIDRMERVLAGAGTADELLRTNEAAKLAKVKPATILRWGRAGHLKRYGSKTSPRWSRLEVLRVQADDAETPEAIAARIAGEEH